MTGSNVYREKARFSGLGVPVLIILVMMTAFDLTPFFAAVLFLAIAFMLALISIHANLLTPVQLVIFAYVLAFPMAVLLPDYFQSVSKWAPSPLALEQGMLWSLRGFAMFALGYALVDMRKGVNQYPKRGQFSHFLKARHAQTVYVTKWVGLLATVGFISSVVMQGGITMPGITAGSSIVASKYVESNTLQQILILLSELRYPFFSMFLILRYYKQTNRTLTIILSFLLTASIIEFMVSGSKGDLIRIVVSIFLAMSLLPFRLNLKKVLLVIVALLIVSTTFSVVGEYRSIMSREYARGADISSFTVQISSFKLAFSRTLILSDAEGGNEGVSSETIASRFASPMFSFANLLRFTNGHSPYEHAWKSFLVPVYSVLPRSLAPGKPIFFNSSRYAAEYYGWVSGGISVSLPGSFYFAWGYPGVLLGMFFFGGVLAFIVKQVNNGGVNSAYWVVILVTKVMILMAVGFSFQAELTSVIRVALLLLVLHFFYSKVSRRRQHRQRMPFDISNSQSSPE